MHFCPSPSLANPEIEDQYMVEEGNMCRLCDLDSLDLSDQPGLYVTMIALLVGTCGLARATDTDRASLQDKVDDAESARLVVQHTSSMVKIVTGHLQQVCLFLQWPWGWPQLLVDVGRWLGSILLPNLLAMIDIRCASKRDSTSQTGVGGAAGILNSQEVTGIALPMTILNVIVFLLLASHFMSQPIGFDVCRASTLGLVALIPINLIFVIISVNGMLDSVVLYFLLSCCLAPCCCLSYFYHRKSKQDDDAENTDNAETVEVDGIAYRSAHFSNFGWAAFTMGSPMAVSSICYYARTQQDVQESSGATYDGWGLGGLPLFVLFIPLVGLMQLRDAKASGGLHSDFVNARYGWLCSRCAMLPVCLVHNILSTPDDRWCRYRAEGMCPYWELLMLEVRFAIMIIGSVIGDPLISALLVAAATSGLLVIQAVSKPFLETPEQEAHWSSVNKLAVVSYACTLVFLLVGLVSILSGPVGGGFGHLLSSLGLIALAIPVILTARIIQGVDHVGSDDDLSNRATAENPINDVDAEKAQTANDNKLDTQ